MPNFQELSKAEQIRALKGLRDNDTFRWLLEQADKTASLKRGEIFDQVPQTLGDLLEREQNIGGVRESGRVAKTLTDSIAELEDEIKHEAPA